MSPCPSHPIPSRLTRLTICCPCPYPCPRLAPVLIPIPHQTKRPRFGTFSSMSFFGRLVRHSVHDRPSPRLQSLFSPPLKIHPFHYLCIHQGETCVPYRVKGGYVAFDSLASPTVPQCTYCSPPAVRRILLALLGSNFSNPVLYLLYLLYLLFSFLFFGLEERRHSSRSKQLIEKFAKRGSCTGEHIYHLYLHLHTSPPVHSLFSEGSFLLSFLHPWSVWFGYWCL